MTKFFLIACGGALGAPLRFAINDLMKNLHFFTLPTGIMLVNFIGCFCIGIAMAYISDLKSNIYFFLIIGFLGSFTTMSALTYQTILMANTNFISALSYIIITITLTLFATYLGALIAK